MQKQFVQLKTAMMGLEESDREILNGLLKKLEKHKKLDGEEAEEYVDFLLGLAAECEDVPEQAIYDVVEYIQEQG
ncbi:MAG: hypothetical protein IJV50_05575 [Lachnospiraceae bacterium]|nr:hypothetical protein [Lachnospiraceae bacterium]